MINDKCKMIDKNGQRSIPWAKKGFSLIELVVVLSLMASLALFLGYKINNLDKNDRFYKTCHRMEEIKEAVTGRPALYCNGIRQVTGYASDMGKLPGLYYVDEDVNRVELHKGDDISQILENCKYPPQPKALWTRDMNADRKNEITDDALWKYHAGAGIWAGWKGPYFDYVSGETLKDAWGNPFVFMIGELVTRGEKTYRCINTHAAVWDAGNWEELSDRMQINAKVCNFSNKDIFYDDAMEIISYGKDGKPGGEKLDKDLVLTIYRQEWTGEVAGHVGYSGNYVGEVTLYYPEYTEGKNLVKSKNIKIRDNDGGYGVNFRFGTVCEKDDPAIEIDCNYASYVNFQKVSIPIGIRSIKAGGELYMLSVTEGGNWVGTFE